MAVLRSLTCAAVILSLLQENNLSKSMPHRVKCRTKAVNHVSRSLETWKMIKIIYQSQNLWTNRISDTTPNSVSTWTWAMCNLPSNMKSSSHKTWKTSLLFWKPLRVQNVKRKSVGTWHIISPVSTTKLRPSALPLNCISNICFLWYRKILFLQNIHPFPDEKTPRRRLWSMVEKGQSAWRRLSRHVNTPDFN